MVEIALDSLFVVLIACAVCSCVYWIAVTVQIVLTRRLPTARDGIALGELKPPTQTVCVVVPCHNEAGNIGRLIGSLREQDYDRLRVVLALDRCTDDTIGVARQAIGDDVRFEIVEIDHCPDGWAGKVNAAHSGFTESEHARASEVLIFTDADTWLDPGCVRACVAMLNDRGLEFLSLLSTLHTQSWFERVVQPITAFELARQFPLLRVNADGRRRRAFANGQFMMFTSSAYQSIGGHERVKDAILEDIMFAQCVKHLELGGGLFLADNMLKCRMYDSWDEYVRGWKRIYTESANREVKRLKRYALRTPMLWVVLPLTCVLLMLMSIQLRDPSDAQLGIALGASGLFAWVLGTAAVYKMSRAPLRDLPMAMLGAVLTGRLFQAAADDLVEGTPTVWGGKSYVRQAEDS